MTRKDYTALAGAVMTVRSQVLVNHVSDLIKATVTLTCDRLSHELSDRLSRDNPQFDRLRFLEACGVN